MLPKGEFFVRKTAIILITIVFLFSTLPYFASGDSIDVSIDTSSISLGLIRIKVANYDGKRLKLMIIKDGTSYVYNLNNYGVYNNFPLQLGSGEYSVLVLENVRGIKYRIIYKELVNARIKNINQVYLNSVQLIEWNESIEAVKKARSLTKGIGSDIDKVKAVYKYIVSNIEYDDKKLDKLTYDYLPNIDKTMKNGTGICYDFASLFASMMRSVGVPTKLVKGYTDEVEGYHAWNEVYIKSERKWITIDTSYDSQMKNRGLIQNMIKDASFYRKVREY